MRVRGLNRLVSLSALLGTLGLVACSDDTTSGSGVDGIPPTLTLTSADTSATAAYTLTGTATDDVGVTSLEYHLNDAATGVPITIADAFSAPLTLLDGPNTIRVAAADAAGNTAIATLTVTADVNQAPVATDDAARVDEDDSVDITLAGNDPDGDSITFAIADAPANGQVSGTPPAVTYTPAPDFAGSDRFTFTASDGDLTSEAATVTITVNPFNDGPEANARAVSTDEDTILELELSGTDVDDDALTVEVVAPPEHGTLDTTSLPDVTYTPDENYNGADTLTFTVSDGEVTSAPAAIDITVEAVNDAPVAIGPANAVTTREDTTVNVRLEGADIEDSALTFRITTTPSHGSLRTVDLPTARYLPAMNYNGPDSFAFVANDGELDSEPVTVDLTVTAVNDAPDALDAAVDTNEDTPLRLTLTATDIDTPTGSLVFSITTRPELGSLDDSTLPIVVYSPAPDFAGEVTFDFQVSDGSLQDTATVTVTVLEGTVFYLSPDGSNANSGLFPDEPKQTLGFENGVMVLVDPDGNDVVNLADGRYCEAGFNLTKSVHLVGTGADRVFLDGRSYSPPCVDPGVVACDARGDEWAVGGVLTIAGGFETPLDVVLSDLTVENGLSVEQGGGLLNYGNLTLERVVVQDNCAADGGGIATLGPGPTDGLLSLVLVESLVRNNEASVRGGGISAAATDLSVLGSDVIDNRATGPDTVNGGGLYIVRGGLTLRDASIDRNEAVVTSPENGQSVGGGLFALNAAVVVERATISGNRAGSLEPIATAFGGGAYVNGGTLVACPLDPETGEAAPDCFAEVDGNHSWSQAGLTVIFGNAVLANLRVTNNVASLQSGGLFFLAGTATLIDSVIQGNQAVASTLPCAEGDPVCNPGSVGAGQLSGGLGAISADLELDAVQVLQNTAGDLAGGCFLLGDGSLVARGSLFADNVAAEPGPADDNVGLGGGLLVASGYFVLLEDSLVTGNHADQSGGGFYVDGLASVTLERTEVSGNSARALFDPEAGAAVQSGGGLAVLNSSLTLTDCLLADNETADRGGALFASAAELNVSGTTFTDNRARSGAELGDEVLGAGGAIYFTDGAVGHLVNTTLSANSADWLGAALYNATRSAEGVRLSYVTIADNAIVVPAAAGIGEPVPGAVDGNFTTLASILAYNDPANCGFLSFFVADYTLSDDLSCSLEGDADQNGIDPLLGELRDNGGLWPTYLPADDSPVIDLVAPVADADVPFCNTLDGVGISLDQRALPRPVDGDEVAGAACDLGSVEVQ